MVFVIRISCVFRRVWRKRVTIYNIYTDLCTSFRYCLSLHIANLRISEVLKKKTVTLLNKKFQICFFSSVACVS